mmetsp:Transcript_10094/g.17758  ORF Transcript_10094/g.17758 Transcript_10094/m.17758 type:complete len:292 (-) Transcript_10094:40-915(-)
MDLDERLIHRGGRDAMGDVELAFWTPLLLSLLAGAATGLGGMAILLLGDVPRPQHMSFSLALAAGVMVSVSLVEMYIPMVIQEGLWWPSVTLAIGASLFLVMLKVLPHPEDYMLPTHYKINHSRKFDDGDRGHATEKSKQWRLGMILMITLTLHNLPEGLAVSVSELKDPNLGFVVTVAIALHNIPEGLAISVPLYAASGRRRFAIGMAFISGLSEPLGAWLALTFLRPYFIRSPWMVDYVLCLVSGIMLAVATWELIPEARAHKDPNSLVLGFIVGFVIILATHMIEDSM